MQVVNTIWALARLRVEISEDFRISLEDTLQRHIPGMPPQAIGKTAWGLVCQPNVSTAVLEMLAKEALSNKDVVWKAPEVSNLIWGLTKLGHRSTELLIWVRNWLDKGEGITGQTLSSIAWATAQYVPLEDSGSDLISAVFTKVSNMKEN